MDWYLYHETGPRVGTHNMACDLHLLELVESGRLEVPVLRLYGWLRPTLSLGYHQKWASTVDQDALARYGIDLVRRWTGGRGVLHETDEITYSLIAPQRDPFKARVTHNYQLIGGALERFTLLEGARGFMSDKQEDGATVRSMRGLPCFASISQAEIERQGQKLIGSAQKLGKSGFLQHGSIPMTHRHQVLNEITATKRDVSHLMTGINDLYEAAGLAKPQRGALSERLIAAFGEFFGVGFRPLPEGVPDEARIEAIAAERFANEAWTYRK